MASSFDTESLTDSLAQYSRPIGIGALVVAAAVGGTVIWQRTQASNSAKAESAYFEASRAFEQGDLEKAAKELEKVATRYAGYAGGHQAAMLQAQALYQQGKFAEGMKLLEGLKTGPEFEAARHALLAAGAEDMGKFEDAAGHYEAASKVAVFDLDKQQYRADQARALMQAGKRDASIKLWTELAQNEKSPFSTEAKVRLGELLAQAAKN